jgi:hypothetical protein
MDDAIPVTDLTAIEGAPVAPEVRVRRERGSGVAVRMRLGPVKLAFRADGRPVAVVIPPIAIVLYLTAATIPAAGAFVAGQVLGLAPPVVGAAALAVWIASAVLVSHLLRTGRPRPRARTRGRPRPRRVVTPAQESRRSPDRRSRRSEEGGHVRQCDDGTTASPML